MRPKLFDEFGNSIRHVLTNPSEKLIDKSSLLTLEKRKHIIDLASKCVSKNTFYTLGRSSMCLQFALLVKYMLSKENIASKVIKGTGKYTAKDKEFTWEHFWVETYNQELIDCNIDSIIYHPDSPEGIEPSNYWGDINSIPEDRTFTNRQVFSEHEINNLESEDNETVIWKNEIDTEY